MSDTDGEMVRSGKGRSYIYLSHAETLYRTRINPFVLVIVALFTSKDHAIH